MNFVDIAKIQIASGKGGNGHISFRKEKYVPKGGPDGGNGGKGGSVIIKANPHLNTLLDFKYKRHFLAEDGLPGGKSRKSGRDGKNIIIKVPQGTVVKDIEDNILFDLSDIDSEVVIAEGGNGGWGNSMFATSTNQAPRFANPGLPGTEMDITLELKLLADVGLVGYPNVGKSTLISVLSAAKPKIADYPFTTLVPNLGIVSIEEGKNFTVADIPGLIEGASSGKGLGIQFLRHVERCRTLVFLISADSEDPKQDYKILRNELEKYNPEMAYKKRIICFSKTDIVDTDRIKELKKITFNEKLTPKILISSVMHSNTNELKQAMWRTLEEQEQQ
ncbi:MAG TPA: GTPase ObgE [Candidatus Kapabacteria bacterium]|nr:GTPase ObgE [Candidatus Kapabacteria bacterium]